VAALQACKRIQGCKLPAEAARALANLSANVPITKQQQPQQPRRRYANAAMAAVPPKGDSFTFQPPPTEQVVHKPGEANYSPVRVFDLPSSSAGSSPARDGWSPPRHTATPRPAAPSPSAHRHSSYTVEPTLRPSSPALPTKTRVAGTRSKQPARGIHVGRKKVSTAASSPLAVSKASLGHQHCQYSHDIFTNYQIDPWVPPGPNPNHFNSLYYLHSSPRSRPLSPYRSPPRSRSPSPGPAITRKLVSTGPHDLRRPVSPVPEARRPLSPGPTARRSVSPGRSGTRRPVSPGRSGTRTSVSPGPVAQRPVSPGPSARHRRAASPGPSASRRPVSNQPAGQYHGQPALQGNPTSIMPGLRNAAKALSSLPTPPTESKNVSVAELTGYLMRDGPGERWASAAWAAGILANRPMTNEDKNTCCQLGGIKALVAMLQAGANTDVCRVAAAALSVLCYNHPGNCNAVRQAGGIGLLAAAVSQGRKDGEIVLWATCALTQVTYKNTDNCRALLATDAINSILRILGTFSERETRGNAIRILCNLAHLPEACAAIRQANGIPMLVSELSSAPKSETALVAARTLLNIACNEGQQSCIQEAGGIPALVRLLDLDPKADIVMVAALTITQLALGSEENCASIRQCGGVAGVMRLLRCGPQEEVTRVALGALLNLANHSQTCEEVRKAGGIPELLRLLKASAHQSTVQLQAARVLSNLALNKHNSNAVRLAGGVPLFVDLASGPPSSDIARVAAVALSQLAFDNPTNQNAIRDAGGILPLVRLLSPSHQETSKWAACALAELAFNNDANCASIAAAGGIGKLASLLKVSMEKHVIVQVVRALANLALNSRNQEEIREQNAIPHVVSLLKQSPESQNAMVVGACALAELAFSNTYNSNTIVQQGGLSQLLHMLATQPEGPVQLQTVRAIAEILESSSEGRRAAAKDDRAVAELKRLADRPGAQAEGATQARRILAHLCKEGESLQQPYRWAGAAAPESAPASPPTPPMPYGIASDSYLQSPPDTLDYQAGGKAEPVVTAPSPPSQGVDLTLRYGSVPDYTAPLPSPAHGADLLAGPSTSPGEAQAAALPASNPSQAFDSPAPLEYDYEHYVPTSAAFPPALTYEYTPPAAAADPSQPPASSYPVHSHAEFSLPAPAAGAASSAPPDYEAYATGSYSTATAEGASFYSTAPPPQAPSFTRAEYSSGPDWQTPAPSGTTLALPGPPDCEYFLCSGSCNCPAKTSSQSEGTSSSGPPLSLETLLTPYQPASTAAY